MAGLFSNLEEGCVKKEENKSNMQTKDRNKLSWKMRGKERKNDEPLDLAMQKSELFPGLQIKWARASGSCNAKNRD